MEVQDGCSVMKRSSTLFAARCRHRPLHASKLITTFPQSEPHALPAVQAVLVLFDARRPSACVMDGTEITYWRTAAVRPSAQAARRRTSNGVLVVVRGCRCGLSMRILREAITRRVLIWNRTCERAVASPLINEKALQSNPSADLAAATRIADIISFCTRSHVPGAWRRLAGRRHLDLVGGYKPDTREADARLLPQPACSWIAASRLSRRRDIRQPIASGAIRESACLAIFTTWSAVCRGPSSASDITFFKNAGGGHLDLMTAALVFQQHST